MDFFERVDKRTIASGSREIWEHSNVSHSMAVVDKETNES